MTVDTTVVYDSRPQYVATEVRCVRVVCLNTCDV